ncbi:putative P450 monooxygenase [Zopfia rhizophila CBS 207.26]|uniref:Putative P450 monooxygenase n=1 Tax=Zopfia rhizophila CBS 207.26 TaxID=1314779 RepID=A0A6A6DMJ3_9PEZI|nr:putative P450 monooxygenase [Zopfia rhizophila CBS 207.26]
MGVFQYIEDISLYQVFLVLSSTSVLYAVSLAIHRLYLSPLAKFPGPKLAAATLWYEFYYDVIKRGRFAWEIKRMHEVYGPIVRINPFELHINDPEFYDELYTGSSRKRNKFEWSADMFSIPESMISTVSHDLHRRRRAPIAQFFSPQAIRRFDPVIRTKLELLCSRLKEYEKTGEPAVTENAFTALTSDIITEYSFGISTGYLEMPGFNPTWLPGLLSASENSLLHKQIPWITSVMRSLPVSLLLKLKPEMGNFVIFQEAISIEKQINAVQKGEIKPHANGDHPTIFHAFLASGEEVTPGRLLGEGQTLVAAGSLTTAHYLKATTYHILHDPPVLKKLKAEVQEAMPNPSVLPPFRDLDRLPYLNAVVNEGFRLSHGVIARLTRVAPDESLKLNDWVIPAGTPVGMSTWLQHLNASLFPNPDDFRPERWLEPDADRLKKYLVNFTKGSRVCLGKDLARTKIVYTLCALFRRFDMELYETDRSDVDIAHDFFNPSARLDSKGMRVIFKAVNS